MFETSVIVAYESLSCPQCEKKCWKTKYFVGAEGFFSEEQQEVKLFRTNNGPMNNYHKKKKTGCGSFRGQHSIKN